MLRMVLKNGESIKLGDNIIVKSMTEGSCQLAVDAPREVKIERFDTEKPKETPVAGADGKKKYIVVNNKK